MDWLITNTEELITRLPRFADGVWVTLLLTVLGSAGAFVLSIVPSTTASPPQRLDRVCSAVVGPFVRIYAWRLGGGRCWVRNDGQTEDEKDAPGKAGRSPMPASGRRRALRRGHLRADRRRRAGCG